MKVEVLTTTQMARYGGATHLFKVPYTDLTDTAATTLTQNLTTGNGLPDECLARLVAWRVATEFDGGATSELTVAVGYDRASGTDDPNGFAAAFSVHADATPVPVGPVPIADVSTEAVNETYGTEESTVLASLRTNLDAAQRQQFKAFSDAWDLELAWTATDANLSTLTAGELWIFMQIVDLSKV